MKKIALRIALQPDYLEAVVDAFKREGAEQKYEFYWFLEDEPVIWAQKRYHRFDAVIVQLRGSGRPDVMDVDAVLVNNFIDRFRQVSDAPIMILTSRSEEHPVVQSLLQKIEAAMEFPFDPEELVGTIRIILWKEGV